MPIVAIVGRPNVGKSTLFNRIHGSRRALVDDFPGVTRDRNYAEVSLEGRLFTLVDTGGFVLGAERGLEEETRRQVLAALEAADVILFVADGRAGLLPDDAALVDLVRRTGRPVFFCANKIDGPDQKSSAADEFYALGVERVYEISGLHGYGVSDLLDDVLPLLPPVPEPSEEEGAAPEAVRVAFVGRPNVGKSTLVNALLGTERVIVSPLPGTTRDAVDSELERGGTRYVLVDTAGIRRKGKTSEKIEKLSVIKALQSIDRCDVAVLLLDAVEGPTDQDLHIGGYIQERRRGALIAVNKTDLLPPGRLKALLATVAERFKFLPFAPVLAISAATGKGVQRVLPETREVFLQYTRRVPTSQVNQALRAALEAHEPPMVRGRRLKFFFATQTSVRPPTFVVFCNAPKSVHFSYERYLANRFREAFDLGKSPLRILFRPRRRDEENR